MKIEDFVKSGEKTCQLACYGGESRYVLAVGDPVVLAPRVSTVDVQPIVDYAAQDFERDGVTVRVVAHKVNGSVEVSTLWLFDDVRDAVRESVNLDSAVFDTVTSKFVNVTEITR